MNIQSRFLVFVMEMERMTDSEYLEGGILIGLGRRSVKIICCCCCCSLSLADDDDEDE